MLNLSNEQIRWLLKIGFALLATFYVAMPLFLPREVDGIVIWLNDTDPQTAYWLAAVRAMAATASVLAMFNLGKLMLKFPRTKRFYFFFFPLPFSLTYYMFQLISDGSEVVPRNGFVLMNLSGTLIMASVAVMAGILSWAYKDTRVEPHGFVRG